MCGTESIDLISAYGVDRVIDYKKEDFTKLDTTFDHIFDTVGKSSFGKCKPLLKNGGSYISSELGDNDENIFFSLTTSLFSKKKVRFPFPTNTRKSIDYIIELIEAGSYKPLIDRSYPLSQLAEACHYVLTEQKLGNVVIDIPQ